MYSSVILNIITWLCSYHHPFHLVNLKLYTWSEVKVAYICLTLWDRMDHTAHGILQSRILEWLNLSLLQGILPTQGSNPGLLCCRQILYQLSQSAACHFSSVAQLCLTLCDPMDCSTPGFPVHHQLLELTQTHVHWVSDTIQPSYTLLSPSPPAFNLS